MLAPFELRCEPCCPWWYDDLPEKNEGFVTFVDNKKPSEVRHQTGSFLQVFLKHEKDFKQDTDDKWTEALRKLRDPKRWDLKEVEKELKVEASSHHVEREAAKLQQKPIQKLEDEASSHHVEREAAKLQQKPIQKLEEEASSHHVEREAAKLQQKPIRKLEEEASSHHVERQKKPIQKLEEEASSHHVEREAAKLQQKLIQKRKEKASSHHVEMEAAKLQTLIQKWKEKTAKLASILYLPCLKMTDEYSFLYQVIFRAMESVINQYGCDIELWESFGFRVWTGGTQMERYGKWKEELSSHHVEREAAKLQQLIQKLKEEASSHHVEREAAKLQTLFQK